MSRLKQSLSSPAVRKMSCLPLGCGLLLTGIFLSTAVSATINTGEPSAVGTADKPKFAYQLEGRPDPFVPFITEKAATSNVDMNEIVDAEEPLTGMQLFEPGQLTLVALLTNGPSDTAMVEDFTGKGYILTEGTKIGKRGVVKDIAPNKVIIEETAVTRAGKKIISEVVMLLKKEGEE
ncbi:MAG: pilus assembly protein PilP [Desulforhopalus sp.]